MIQVGNQNTKNMYCQQIVSLHVFDETGRKINKDNY